MLICGNRSNVWPLRCLGHAISYLGSCTYPDQPYLRQSHQPCSSAACMSSKLAVDAVDCLCPTTAFILCSIHSQWWQREVFLCVKSFFSPPRLYFSLHSFHMNFRTSSPFSSSYTALSVIGLNVLFFLIKSLIFWLKMFFNRKGTNIYKQFECMNP